MPKILGLDVGSNSIGWALLDDINLTLIAAGVRIFPEGVDRTQQQTEVSKNAGRRTARGMRRQIARRARRKKRLEKFLEQHGLWIAAFGKERDELLKPNPYALRAKGLDENLTLHEFGRVLLHLNARRGFLSNRKSDRERKKEAEGMLAEISELENRIRERGCRTLGEFLFKHLQDDAHALLRCRHTRRLMFQEEFSLLWGAQSKHHPDVLTVELKHEVEKTIFHQRSMRWSETTIGRCSLTSEIRASRFDRVAQRVRMLQQVNNLRVRIPGKAERTLTQVEREKLLEYVAAVKERKFDDIREHLRLTNCVFNLERGKRGTLEGMPIDVTMRFAFGRKVWERKDETEKNQIVRDLIGFLERDEDEQVWRERAVNEWHMPEAGWEKLLAFEPKGRAAFSATALDRLLPHLEKGLLLMTEDGTPSAFSEAGFQRPDQRVVNQRSRLPSPPSDITNPIVRQALIEVRKLVNAVIDVHGLPNAIHIELARETRGGVEQREATMQRIRQGRDANAKAAERIAKERNVQPDEIRRGDIELVRLWEDQGCECIYSGKKISLAQLLNGEANIDHVWPYSKCLDDSKANKVVCFRDLNTEKGNQTPYEWLHGDQKRFDAVLQRVQALPYQHRNAKLQRFLAEQVVLDDFIERQLRDTSYISSQIRAYVRCLGTDVVCTRGDLTAEIRHQLGFNTLLNPDNNPDKKNRDDHRHHAVDAVVIALTNRSILQRLSGRKREAELFTSDIKDLFRRRVSETILAIWVSYRIRKRVRGRLHTETLYGRTFKPEQSKGDGRPWAKDWVESPGRFVYRVPLQKLTGSMIEDIRDIRVKEIVFARLREKGIDPVTVKKIGPDVWLEPLLLRDRRGKSRCPAVIKTVRVLIKDGTIQPFRNATTSVKPGDVHHICIFERTKPNGARFWDREPVSLILAHERKGKGEPIIRRAHSTDPNARFVMSLSKGEMVRATIDGQTKLLQLVTAVSTEDKLAFVEHNDARPGTAPKAEPGNKKRVFQKRLNALREWNIRKIVVDILGQIRETND